MTKAHDILIRRLGNDGVWARIVQPEELVQKPVCRKGSPQIFISPVYFSDNGQGRPLLGVRTYATHSGSNWKIHMVVYTPNASGTGADTVDVSASFGRMMALTQCV